VTFANLYDRKTPITAADLLNDRVVETAAHLAPAEGIATGAPERARGDNGAIAVEVRSFAQVVEKNAPRPASLGHVDEILEAIAGFCFAFACNAICSF